MTAASTETMSPFADTIMRHKYLHPGEDSWADVARRVVTTVMEPYFPELVDEMIGYVAARKFMPGGRYLYATGRTFNQTQNCLLLRAGDSREEWGDLMRRVTTGSMTGAGIGVVYSDLREKDAPVKGMGGKSTGPLALMQMVNEAGRYIMQGGSRRVALWAGLHWWHPDIFDFITIKDWSEDVVAAKAKDFTAPAPMDNTNISVILDTAFFAAIEDPTHEMHDHAQRVYWLVVEKMLTTAEPGFSIDAFENEGENLRNAPVVADTHVLTDQGYRRVGDVLDEAITVWTGQRWAEEVKFTRTMTGADIVKVTMTGGREIRCEGSHEFLVERYHGAGERRRLTGIDRVPAADLSAGDVLHVAMPHEDVRPLDRDAYTLGYLYGDGSFRDGRAEVSICTETKKPCQEILSAADKVTEADGRGYARLYWRRGFDGHTKETCPSLSREEIPSFIAGLFDADGNYEPTQHRIRLASKHEGFLRDVARLLESVGILAHVGRAGTSTYGNSQGYQLVVASSYVHEFARLIPAVRVVADNLEEYAPYRASAVKVLAVAADGTEDVYCADVRYDEHSFQAEGVIISNCTEVTSADDNDICNLGSINLARIESREEMARVTEVGTAFLIAGTLYSKVPYAEVAETREKNRRLGLGVMGFAEWLVTRGYRYEPNVELELWLDEYAMSDIYADAFADRLGISRPVKTRAIAPTGTIGILAETTTGIEPLFALAYKRRYFKNGVWFAQYVIDATAQRLIDKGVNPEDIETAYDLAKDPERRIRFQAWVQQWVDHGISSTLNLPAVAEQPFTTEDFGTMLLRHLPDLRGVTCYPDGARGGQPLNVVPYAEAVGWEGVEFEEVGSEQSCVSGVCGV